MTLLATFETIVPGGLALRRPTCGAAGTLSVWASHWPETVSGASDSDSYIVPAIRLPVSFLDGRRSGANLPYCPGHRHLDRIIKADHPGVVKGVHDNANPHRTRDMLAPVARRPRAADRL